MDPAPAPPPRLPFWDVMPQPTLQAFHNTILARIMDPSKKDVVEKSSLFRADAVARVRVAPFREVFDLTRLESVGSKTKKFFRDAKAREAPPRKDRSRSPRRAENAS